GEAQPAHPEAHGDEGREGEHLVICGVCGLYWVRRGERGHGFTTASLAAGYLAMALCAVLPSPFFGIPKPHEVLALTAFIARCFGVSRLSFAALVKRRAGRQRLFAITVSSLPLLPVVLAAAAQAYAVQAHLPWVSLGWRARGISMYWG